MKMRTILIFAIMLIPIAAFTQDSLKFMPNAWATEVNVNLLNGNISLNSSLNQIKIRKFVSSSLAYRLAFNFKNINQSSESNLTNPYYSIKTSYKRQTFENNINLGFEKHYNGTKRLSPYIGAELSFSIKKSSQDIEENNLKTEVSGCWYDYSCSGYWCSIVTTERGYNSLGINIVSGVDFYVSKNLFVGFEFLYGISYKVYQDIIVKGEMSLPNLKESDFGYGSNVLNGLRIGYIF